MKSPAQMHFPQIRIDKSQKWLFNPVLKKRFKNRPEERVRLSWLEYLLHQTDVKKSRIGIENPVKSQHATNDLRADLIIHGPAMSPEILIECKAENVAITMGTAAQAARYNQSVGAKYIVLTNGVDDLWFECSNGETKAVPSQFHQTTIAPLERAAEYWFQRGFLKKSAGKKLADFSVHLLNSFWDDGFSGRKRYLAFQGEFEGIPLSHYYKIIDFGDGSRLAVTLLAGEHTGPYLFAVMNEKGVSSGMISADLEKALSNRNPSVTMVKDGKTSMLDADLSTLSLSEAEAGYIKNMPQSLRNFFD